MNALDSQRILTFWIGSNLEPCHAVNKNCVVTIGIVARLECDTRITFTEADVMNALRAAGITVGEHDGTRAPVHARYVGTWSLKAKQSFADLAKGRQIGRV